MPEMGDAFTWNDLFPDEKVSREFLDAFVPRIISIDGERFIWELQLMQNHCTVQCEREGAGADAQIRVGKIVQEPPRIMNAGMERNGTKIAVISDILGCFLRWEFWQAAIKNPRNY